MKNVESKEKSEPHKKKVFLEMLFESSFRENEIWEIDECIKTLFAISSGKE